jgi:nucleoside-diphosphate-sugar epimerase
MLYFYNKIVLYSCFIAENFSKANQHYTKAKTIDYTMTEKILITGACGQLGTELTIALQQKFGAQNVLATDIKPTGNNPESEYRQLDVMDKAALEAIVQEFQPTQVYHLAALLSAMAEKHPNLAWELNITGLMHVLDVCKAQGSNVKKVFVPSSIAAFGPNTPKVNTPQITVTDPVTVYGITKLVGERLCEYYFRQYGLDVRSIRYPGLISYKTPPGGGTTDYAVDIFHKAIQYGEYTCYLKADTPLPMMYMDDAIRGTIQLMDAPQAQVKIRSSYNLTGVTFTPAELASSIQSIMPNFQIHYAPDFRQAIADSWPGSIDDSAARADWGWRPEFDLQKITKTMLEQLSIRIGSTV